MPRLAGIFSALVWLGMTAAPASAGPVPSVRLADVDQRLVDPFQTSPDVKAIVFLFTSIECPISNRYAPVVARLHRIFRPKGVQFWLVYPNPLDTADDIRKHQSAFSYPMRALLDPDHALAKLTNVATTPEAALYDRHGRQLYHGRIDDRYVSLGLERPAPTRHDLEDAISATLAGRPVAAAVTPAVGCFLADFVR